MELHRRSGSGNMLLLRSNSYSNSTDTSSRSDSFRYMTGLTSSNLTGTTTTTTTCIDYMEKRQVFLRSYQFRRKKTLVERIKSSFFRVRKIIWIRLRSVRRIRRLIWTALASAFHFRRSGRSSSSSSVQRSKAKQFIRLVNNNDGGYHYDYSGFFSSSTPLWYGC